MIENILRGLKKFSPFFFDSHLMYSQAITSFTSFQEM